MTTPRQVLDTPMPDNDAEAATIRDYLVKLLLGVWKDRECFSGKRPFGNSGWDSDLHLALAMAGHIQATIDNDGPWLDEISYDEERKADKLIDDAICSLGTERP